MNRVIGVECVGSVASNVLVLWPRMFWFCGVKCVASVVSNVFACGLKCLRALGSNEFQICFFLQLLPKVFFVSS